MYYLFCTQTVVLTFYIFAVKSDRLFSEYDFLVIPVSKGTIKGLAEPLFSIWSKRENHQKYDISRSDIESYGEPSERTDFNILFYDNDGIIRIVKFKPRLREDYNVVYDSGDFKFEGLSEKSSFNVFINNDEIKTNVNSKTHLREDYDISRDLKNKVPSEISKVDIFINDDEIKTTDESKPHLREDCDLPYGSGEFRIVGGYEVDINSHPYHVGYGMDCGGAIIGKKYVLTAAHCGEKPYIRAGSTYFNRGKKVLVKRHILHPMWLSNNKKHTFDYDFQILELAEPLKFNDNIQPIKIARMEDMGSGKLVTVTGWGRRSNKYFFSPVLRAVRLPIISMKLCQSVPLPIFNGSLTPRMFCAGFSKGKKDACQGDSGGPAVYNDRLMGLVSFGYGCARPGVYGVYSNVAKVRDWIKSVTGLRMV